ncbi:hypothetical protein GQR58_029200 [Nymphon striatum]|nr:hypothetical protein GQR58_029200 [Nymphon striatum]
MPGSSCSEVEVVPLAWEQTAPPIPIRTPQPHRRENVGLPTWVVVRAVRSKTARFQPLPECKATPLVVACVRRSNDREQLRPLVSQPRVAPKHLHRLAADSVRDRLGELEATSLVERDSRVHRPRCEHDLFKPAAPSTAPATRATASSVGPSPRSTTPPSATSRASLTLSDAQPSDAAETESLWQTVRGDFAAASGLKLVGVAAATAETDSGARSSEPNSALCSCSNDDSRCCTRSCRRRSSASAVTSWKGAALPGHIVINNGTVYLSGQVAADPDADIQEQTRSTLGRIDDLLLEVFGHGADGEMIARFADVAEIVNSSYVDKHRWRGQAELHHGDQRMPTSKQLGFVAILAQQGDGLLGRLGDLESCFTCHAHDGLHDVVVAGAAAQVAFEAFADLGLGWVRVLFQERRRRHDHAWRAVSTLQSVALLEGFLHRVPVLITGGRASSASAVSKSLDGGDLGTSWPVRRAWCTT